MITHTFIVSHLPFLALLVTSFFLWCYIVLASTEFGASLFLLFPKLAGGLSISQILSPIWETNNVFLVGCIVSLIAFFPGFIPWIASALFIPIILFLIFSGFRIILILIFFYSEWHAFQKNILARLALALCAFAAPAMLAWIGVIIITGISPAFWPASLGWALVPAICVAVTSLVAFASVGIHFFHSKMPVPRSLKTFTDLSCILYGASALWFFKTLPLFAAHAVAVGAGFSTTYFISAIALLLALGIVLIGRLSRQPRSAFVGLSAVAGILVAYVAILQRPYLIYPFITTGSAFTALATAKILFIAFAVGIILLIPSLLLLYRLFVFQKR